MEQPSFDRKAAARDRARVRAAEIAQDAIRDGHPADRALNAFFRENHQLGSRDRRAIAESVFALFRWLGWTRRVFSRNEDLLKVLDASVELDRALVPDVGLETLGAGFFRDRAASPPPAPLFRYLLPDWVAALAPDAPLEALTNAFQRRPPLWARAAMTDPDALLRELKAEGLDAERHPRAPNAIKIVNARVNLYDLPAFRAGRFEVQDLASQAIGLACAPKPGERWWDVCAGAGGKSLQLAALLNGKGSVDATDIREYKLLDLKRRARRGGLFNIRPKPWDGAPPREKHRGTFDGALVDAPCSCSGTWRRNPDARWRSGAQAVEELTETQTKILRAAAEGVKPGGVLVYATCSFFPLENQKVVEAFLAADPRFQPDPFENPITGAPADGQLNIFPDDGDCDAVFIARLRRSA